MLILTLILYYSSSEVLIGNNYCFSVPVKPLPCGVEPVFRRGQGENK